MAIIHLAINEAGRRIGQDHHRAKLTNGEVDLILQMREQGMSYMQLARKFEISKSQIRNIVLGRKRCQYASAFRVVHLTD